MAVGTWLIYIALTYHVGIDAVLCLITTWLLDSGCIAVNPALLQACMFRRCLDCDLSYMGELHVPAPDLHRET